MTDNRIGTLANYIKSLSDFKYVKPDVPYGHMGATIVDAMLQAGLRYETVVKPRVDKIHHEYPDAKTTSGFSDLIKTQDLKKILDWNNSEKPNRIIDVTNFFLNESIENEPQLKVWLENEENLVKLDGVKGVGNKTLDYFKFLTGIPTTAIDRHLLNFLNSAGITTNSYQEAKEMVNKTADSLKVDRTLLDHSIWKYMSEKKGRKGYRSCSSCQK
jgi:hypothetical protein